MDYHNCGLCLYSGNGMQRPDTKEYIFWRTPGYPLFLSAFYKAFGIKQTKITDDEVAIYAALWVQVFINSFIPLIILFLAFSITSSTLIATITAWIVTLHPGFILSSGFLLSEGLALLFFFLFLWGFYLMLYPSSYAKASDSAKQPTPNLLRQGYVGQGLRRPEASTDRSILYKTILTALALGATTWIRPMGQFVLVLAIGLLLVFDKASIRNRLKKIALFTLIFFATIFPWYIRNYNLTGQPFFCPMFGVYLNTFNAPKIVRRIKQIPLESAIRMLYEHAHVNIDEKKKRIAGTGKVIAKETEAGQLACKIIWAHPFWFAYDWLQEVLKTTFDLYAYQFVALYNNTFKYDPIEEFLPTKWAETLWRKPLPLLARLLAWLEVIYTLFLWIGIVIGSWIFMLKPTLKKGFLPLWDDPNRLWLMTALIAAALVFMTGGFGYARLRLPVEPLLIILALLGWLQVAYQTKKR